MADIDFTSIFKEQAAGQIKRIVELALTLEETGQGETPDKSLLQDLMREFHTLKGAARAIQYLDHQGRRPRHRGHLSRHSGKGRPHPLAAAHRP